MGVNPRTFLFFIDKKLGIKNWRSESMKLKIIKRHAYSFSFYQDRVFSKKSDGFENYCYELKKSDAAREKKFREFCEKNAHKFYRNGDAYEAFEAMIDNDYYEVETASIEQYAAVLLAEVEVRFERMALLAEADVSTRKEEEHILRLKDVLTELKDLKKSDELKNDVVGIAKIDDNGIRRLKENASTETLRKTDPRRSYVISYDCKNDEYKIITCSEINYQIYVIYKEVDRKINVKVAWDGEHFVCAYLDNMSDAVKTKLLEFQKQM